MKKKHEHQLSEENAEPLDWQIKGILGLYLLVAVLLVSLALFG